MNRYAFFVAIWLVPLFIACDAGVSYRVENRKRHIEASRASDSLFKELEAMEDTIHRISIINGDTVTSYTIEKH